MTVKIGVAGATGRMGRAVVTCAWDRPDVQLCALLSGPDSAGEREQAGVRVTDRPKALFDCADVVIDFTAPEATVRFAQLAADSGTALVSGTTGLDARQQAMVDLAGERAAILQAANFSLGVNLLLALTRTAARALGADWDIEILEMHHRQKVDAPSGTALALGAAAADGRDRSPADALSSDRPVFDRKGKRQDGAIGYAVLRGGTVPGDHSVIFAGPDERVMLSHAAGDRSIFAKGAVSAAVWLAGKAPGRYGMADMLGLSVHANPKQPVPARRPAGQDGD